MPARKDIHKVLIVGSGPIVIGQACEFDYSGTQAVRALKEEGYEVVLVNPNPATVMTTPGIADRIYVEPLTVSYVEEIIKTERPDAILPTMGGQTGLNLTMRLHEAGIFERYGVEVIGASVESIRLAEDRGEFKRVCESIGLDVPRSVMAKNVTGSAPVCSSGRPPDRDPAELHPRRTGRRDRLYLGSARELRGAGARRESRA